METGQNNGLLSDYSETVFDFVPLTGMIVDDPFYSSFSPPHNPAFNIPELWDEVRTGFEDQLNQQQLLFDDFTNNGTMVTFDENFYNFKEKKIVKRSRKVLKTLSRKTISQYFYMPITQVAIKLNVGLTLLKNRCRELGIRRWPHRKLMSIQTLIKNIQELEKEEGDEKLKELQKLEQEMKLMEEIPDRQLEEKTKRLRLKYFQLKVSKKRELLLMGTKEVPVENVS